MVNNQSFDHFQALNRSKNNYSEIGISQGDWAFPYLSHYSLLLYRIFQRINLMQELIFLTTLLTFIIGGTVSSNVIFFAFFRVQTKIRSMLQTAGGSSFVPYEETF